jgi:hypothetical protein
MTAVKELKGKEINELVEKEFKVMILRKFNENKRIQKDTSNKLGK